MPSVEKNIETLDAVGACAKTAKTITRLKINTMTFVTRTIFGFLLCVNIFGCTNKGSNDSGIKLNKPNFTLSILKSSIKLVHSNTYIGEGKIINQTSYLFSSYFLRIKFVLTDEKGESFLSRETIGYEEDGFGEGLTYMMSKMPWKPNEEKKFKLRDFAGHDDMVYPVSNVKVRYIVSTSDPKGNDFEEIIGEYDITDMWLKAQKKYISTLKKR